MSQDFVTNQILELRRGTIVVAILNILHTRHYGYGLLQALERAGVPVDAGTLYPMLRRLEKQGILSSVWETSDSPRPRKYYWLSKDGEVFYKKLADEWLAMTHIMQNLITKD